MSLALHYWMRRAHHCSGPPVSEITYTVSSGTLNSTILYYTCRPYAFLTPAQSSVRSLKAEYKKQRWWQLFILDFDASCHHHKQHVQIWGLLTLCTRSLLQRHIYTTWKYVTILMNGSNFGPQILIRRKQDLNAGSLDKAQCLNH